mgnify:FL=1|tara:strand:+ start:967 stop:1698 length:732 start_codon:yes stop_codon:yes gene_type:complete
MRIYLDDNIFIEHDILYTEEEGLGGSRGKIKKLKETDWHLRLSNYGWSKLNKKWIIKLNKLSKSKNKNSLFGVLDCGGGGDCLFNCISYAISDDKNTDPLGLRTSLSEYITEEKFMGIIDIYRILNETGDFEEFWDPNLTSFECFKKRLKEGGDGYWGDSLILDFLKEYLNINVIILYSNDITNEYYHYPILHNYDKDKNTIVLLYKDEIHFQLIGHFSENNMNTLFNIENIPEEIVSMVKLR